MSDSTGTTGTKPADEQDLRRALVRRRAAAAAYLLIDALLCEDATTLAALIGEASGHVRDAEAEILRAPLG